MVRSLCKADGLGGPENVWNMCQQFYHAHAHTNLAELTRADSGWPEHRRHLAQTLLTNGRFMALAEYHAPAAPERAGQWLGCLALVTLATAGQQANENRLDARSLQLWLQKQIVVDQGPSEHKRVAPIMTPQPVPPTATAPWWPLVVLAVVGIGASSYFYQQQTGAAQLLPPAPATKALAALPPVVASVSLTASQASTVEPRHARPHAARAASSDPVPDKPVTLSSKASRKASVPSAARSSAELPIASLAPRMAHPEASSDASESTSGVDRSQAPALAQPENASTETLLYKRLANPDVANRKPIDLDQLSFALGDATLDPAGAKQLGNIANILKSFPHYRLIVFGNAEASEPHSVSLALDRANTVIAELVKQGVPSNVLQAQGHLRSSPDNANNSDVKRRPALYISSLE